MEKQHIVYIYIHSSTSTTKTRPDDAPNKKTTELLNIYICVCVYVGIYSRVGFDGNSEIMLFQVSWRPLDAIITHNTSETNPGVLLMSCFT